MSNAVLASIQANWGLARASDGQSAAPLVPVSPAELGQKLEAEQAQAADTAELAQERQRSEIEQGVARLKDIIRNYPVRPYLFAGGGSGFSYPTTGPWRRHNRPLLAEFSRLWFSAAGRSFIDQYGQRMRVVPAEMWNKDVEVWLGSQAAKMAADADHQPTASPVTGGEAPGPAPEPDPAK